jgi:hypothetical protein
MWANKQTLLPQLNVSEFIGTFAPGQQISFPQQCLQGLANKETLTDGSVSKRDDEKFDKNIIMINNMQYTKYA